MRVYTLEESPEEALAAQELALIAPDALEIPPELISSLAILDVLVPLWQPGPHLSLIHQARSLEELNMLVSDLGDLLLNEFPDIRVSDSSSSVEQHFVSEGRTVLKVMTILVYAADCASAGPGRIVYDCKKQRYSDAFVLWANIDKGLRMPFRMSSEKLVLDCARGRRFLWDSPIEPEQADLFRRAIIAGWTPFPTTPKVSAVLSKLFIREDCEEVCVICHEANAPREIWATRPCGHSAHYVCAEEWGRTKEAGGNRSNCPLCRSL